MLRKSGLKGYLAGRSPFSSVMSVLLLLVFVGGANFALHNAHADSGTTTVDDSVQGSGQNQFNYVGSWFHCTSGCIANSYNNTVSGTDNANDYATIAFTGTQIKLYTDERNNRGIAAVSLDGGSETNVDMYSSSDVGDALVWTSPTLSSGSHTLKVRNTGTHNSSSTGTRVAIDRVDIIAGSSSNCGSASGGPTDNPIDTRYGSGTYSWTDTIKWNCVYNINDYSGATMVDQFNAARDAAAANGGGVVYFPSGTYNFTDNIYLKSGVVIRGDAPSVANATNSSYAPPSKLVFPKYVPSLSGSGTDNSTAFKHIYTTNPKTDSNIGVVNLDINRAGIMFVETHAVRFTSAFDPTTYTGQNMIVFGVRSNNVAVPYGAPDIPSGVPASWQNAWQRYPFPFEANVDILDKANALVANNRLNDLSQAGTDDSFDEPGYLYKNPSNTTTASTGSQIRFDYANVYGITVNGAYLFSRPDSKFTNGWYATDDPNDTNHPYRPYLFYPGNVVEDNWIYHDEGQAIVASGTGLVINNNVIKDTPTSSKLMYVDTGGQHAPGGGTFSTRAVLMGGKNIDTENNNVEAYPWLEPERGSGITTNDGENLLWDNTTTLVNGWTVKNNTLNGMISNFYCQDINNVTISGNTWTSSDNGVSIWETADTDSTHHYSLNNVVVDSNTNVVGTVYMEGRAGGSGNAFTNNSASGSPAFKHTTETSITISGNTGFVDTPET